MHFSNHKRSQQPSEHAMELATAAHSSTTTTSRINSATINLPSTHSEQKMANIIDSLDDSEIPPAHQFVPNQAAHYQQYPFPRGNGNFAADQDLQMAQELSHNIQQGVGDGAPTSAPRNDSHGQNHATDMSQAPIGPGMGPPHNQQSFSGGQGSAGEGTPDQVNMGDGKRKRSKVSRACDECRRKKIRCDATDDDGSIKTCSNCARINQSCSFSRVPMKRGPSKGYIKELSERVQQVESLQMQLAGQPAGYRQSIDSEYSPDEPYSAGRRNFSFSDQRNPFASYPRDRIPSSGGWGVGSPTTPYQARDSRGSIPLAPDQHLADINGPPTNYTRPFWAQEIQEDGRAAKRQKMGDTDDLNHSAESIEQESLAVYFDTIHQVFPILPEQAADLDSMLQTCPAKLTHAFIYVLSLAQSENPPSGNFFKTYQEVEDYIWAQAKIQPSTRKNCENIVFLWVYMFMVFATEQDLSKLQNIHGGLSQATLVKLACDLSTFLTTEARLSIEAPEESEFLLVRRAHYIVGILSTLHAISTGIESPTPLPTMKRDSFAEVSSILPDESALLCRACAVFAILDSFITSPITWKTNPSFALKNKILIEQHLTYVFGSAPQRAELDILCKQIQSLVVILLARHTSISHPLEILTPTLELADSLLENTTATEVVPKYNPLQIHLFSLATLTLLEFNESIDERLVAPAQEGVGKVKIALEQIAERANADTPTDSESMHWSSCLLRIINTHSSSSTKLNGAAEKDPNIDPAMAPKSVESGSALLQGQVMTAYQAARMTGHDGQGDKMMDVKMGVVQVVDMSLLLLRGYLNVVAELSGV